MVDDLLNMAAALGIVTVALLAILAAGLLLIRRGYQKESRAERWSNVESIGREYEQDRIIVEFIHWLEDEYGIRLYVPEGFLPIGPLAEKRMRELVAEFIESREGDNE